MHLKKFDKSKLSANHTAILADFTIRRKAFDTFIKDHSLNRFTCPGCAFPTLGGRGDYEICNVCWWEDDNQDDETADEILGGPNSNISLTENRLKIGHILGQLANHLNGEINTNASEVILILENHNKQMKTINDQISATTDISDPLWTQFQDMTKKILVDLIKLK